jgi:hypothetical protein
VTAAPISATIVAWDDADLEQLLASYYRMCAEAGVEAALPEDEARVQAKAMISVLLPAFDVEFRQH